MDNNPQHNLLNNNSVLSTHETSFPPTIKEIFIHNCSDVTTELVLALLSSIKSVHPKPWNISLSKGLEYNRDDVLYIIICPAGLGPTTVPMPKYYINWQLEYLDSDHNREPYIQTMRGSLG